MRTNFPLGFTLRMTGYKNHDMISDLFQVMEVTGYVRTYQEQMVQAEEGRKHIAYYEP